MKKKLPVFCLVIAASLLLNYFGRVLTTTNSLPFWLDSTGTALSAYLYGPVIGAIVGAASNLIFHITSGAYWMYALVSMATGIVVGLFARRKSLETLFGTLTTTVAVSVTAMVISLPLNLWLNKGSTGNLWGDAVIGFLGERGVPEFLCLPCGQIYVELLDKLITLLLMYLIVKAIRLVLRLIRRKPPETPEQKPDPMKIAALLLAAGLGMAGFAGSSRAAAEEAPKTDRNYNDYVQTIYSSQNGLPCGEANDIAQTSDGILWIGTYAGLYRYNGREFRWMDNYESVRNVNCLYVDEEGRLWIGSNDNGLTIVINEQVANVIDQSGGLPANAVRSIVCSSDGYYYIGTTSSMQILTLNYGLKTINTLQEIYYCTDSAADENGHVAAITNSGTLYLMEKGQILSSLQLPDEEDVFKSCTFDQEGHLLAATTGNKIYSYDVTRGWFEKIGETTCSDLKSIQDLTFLENGELFVSADNGIGYITREGRFKHINTNDFNNSIDNMLIDYQGNLWFTSSRLGLLRLAPSDFRDIYSTAGMQNHVVNTVVEWNGIYYFGTDKGLDAADMHGETEVVNELTKQLAGMRIRCMAVDSQNHLWICTYSHGLLEVDPDGTQHEYNKEHGTFGNRARVVKELNDGTIMATGDTGITFIKDHEVQSTILYNEGQITSMVLTATELPNGRILAGTDGNGIAVLENRQVARMLTRKDGLSSDVILRTVLDPKTGGTFIVTSNGLCYMNPDETIRTLDVFPYFNNYDIWIRGTDDLFVMSSAGIYIVDRGELLTAEKNLNYELLDTRRGLNSSLTANSWNWYDEESGELYLPCDTGVFVINTNHFSSGAKAYRMSVPSARMDGEYRRVNRNSAITVSRGVGRVELYPEVINYSIQEPNVGYMLEGFDSDWTIVPQENLSTIVYTNLPSGEYRFRLAVFDNNMENILAERSYRLVKEKELYDNSWFVFYILLVPMFTVAWVTWVLVKRREQRIQKELAEANRMVEMGKQTVIAIARTVDAKDPRTGGHSQRVALYSKQIAEAAGLSKKECQEIEWSAQMHDIGKIAIPDSILNKDSRLTDEEYAQMKSHTIRGAEILSDFTLLDHVIEGAEYHHERYDGRGYPKGLKGEDIPLYARIIGVADAFDAMTANRVYRKQMDFGYVLGELEKGRGTQFDAKFVDILLKLIHEGTINLNEIYGVKPEETPEQKKAEPAAPDTQGSSGSISNGETGGK